MEGESGNSTLKPKPSCQGAAWPAASQAPPLGVSIGFGVLSGSIEVVVGPISCGMWVVGVQTQIYD